MSYKRHVAHPRICTSLISRITILYQISAVCLSWTPSFPVLLTFITVYPCCLHVYLVNLSFGWSTKVRQEEYLLYELSYYASVLVFHVQWSYNDPSNLTTRICNQSHEDSCFWMYSNNQALLVVCSVIGGAWLYILGNLFCLHAFPPHAKVSAILQCQFLDRMHNNSLIHSQNVFVGIRTVATVYSQPDQQGESLTS